MSGASARTAPSVHRRLLSIAVVVAFALAPAWAPTAAAQIPECPLELVCLDADLDAPAPNPTPGGDPVGGVEETVGETVGGVEETVGETVGGVTGTAEKAVEEATKEVTGTVDTVEETAGDLAGSAVQSPEDPSASGPGGAADVGSGGSRTRTEVMLAREFAHGLGAPSAFLTDAGADVTEMLTQPASESAAAETGSSGGLAGVLGEVATKIAFPLALALVVGGFLLVQNRLDRRDPKLALAPRDTNLLDFE